MPLFFAAISAIIGAVSLLPYIRDIFRGTTKPHAFTWLVWAALGSLSTATLVSSGAGAVVYAVGTGALLCFTIFLLSLRYGVTHFDTFDLVCVVGAGVAALAYFSVTDLLVSVVLITVTDLFGYIPTLRKAYLQPWSETLSTYVLSCVSIGFALLSIESVTVTTTLYLVSVFLTNMACVALLLRGRKSMPERVRGA